MMMMHEKQQRKSSSDGTGVIKNMMSDHPKDATSDNRKQLADTLDSRRQVMQVYVGSFSNLYEALSIEASKQTTAEEIVDCISEKLGLKDASLYELAEVVGNDGGQDCKERRLGLSECPVQLQLLWPKSPGPSSTPAVPSSTPTVGNKQRASTSSAEGVFTGPEYRFCLRRKLMQSTNWSFSWTDSNDSQLLKDYFLRFLYQPRDREYPDLCQLPDLTEQTLLENLKARFEKGHIYTYVGSILIALNPFKFYPIYNPKYVQLYQNRRLGDLPPHIFAIADAAYQAMLKKRRNQCIVISGESGSGKTESTNLLLHHLTALSQKGSHGSGVEQTILGAGPVLEAFGNAKTKFNNNSSRFGKFIQVNYKENGMVHGAIVQKYLLEKSRIVSQAKNERNYHVFYYLLAGCSNEEKEALHLTKASDYFYLNQSRCYTLEGVDEAYELSRLKQSLEMVGFSGEKQKKLMSLLSAVLHLGNVEFSKKSAYHNDETVMVKNPSVVSIISKLLMVKEENLLSALTCKRTQAAKGELIIINYKMADAIATRDAMAKCLYGALFEWIVMQVNSALLSKQDIREHKGNSIGVLDIFGFEDFGDQNYFEQFCINFANEHLHYYFNQHVFKYEQEEYKREGINWKNIDFHDNVACLNLVQGRPHGLLCLLDDQCNFPGASDETVLQKFVNHHSDNGLFEVPPCRQSAFVIKHYAGKVKYQIRDFREKNMDLMRPDIVALLKGSSSAFVRELVGYDPLAIFRWQILKAFFKAYFIFSKIREDSKTRREVNGPSVAVPRNNNILMLTKKLGIECISSFNSSGSSSSESLNDCRNRTKNNQLNDNQRNHNNHHQPSSQTSGGGGSSSSRILNNRILNKSSRLFPVLTTSSHHNNSITTNNHSNHNHNNHNHNNNSPPVNSNFTDRSHHQGSVRSKSNSIAASGNSHLTSTSSTSSHSNHNNSKNNSLSCPTCLTRGSVVTRVTSNHNYSNPCPLHGLLDSTEAKVLLKANQILQKNKINRSPSLKTPLGIEKSIKNLKTLKVIVGKTSSIQGPHRTGRKTTQTVTFQFQQSLNQLMDTLNQANPFFVRCIKSNSDKIPNHFDDMLVLVQLRYTGMLETVRIRQSGYSVRLSFEEFIQHYRILLNRGLLSSQNDVKDFLTKMNLNPDNYQMGNNKIFMRESEKLALDNMLHREILQRIITLQRWVRTWITRRQFMGMRDAAICIQSYVRRWMAQRRLARLKDFVTCEKAAVTIQKSWKAFKERTSYVKLRAATINFQAHARGYLGRKEFLKKKTASAAAAQELHRYQQEMSQKGPVAGPSGSTAAGQLSVLSNIDSQSSHSDEAFLSKGSSQEELEMDRPNLPVAPQDLSRKVCLPRVRKASKDSEDSSGVHEDSESENNLSSLRSTGGYRRRSSAQTSLYNQPPESPSYSPPPPLPPRKASLISTGPSESGIPKSVSYRRSSDMELVASSLTEADDESEKQRLDRRRNRPITRKLSLKKSKSVTSKESSLDYDKYEPPPASGDSIRSKIPLREMISEPGVAPSPTEKASGVTSDEPVVSGPATVGQKGAFSKAKQTLKNIITGGSKHENRKFSESSIKSTKEVSGSSSFFDEFSVREAESDSVKSPVQLASSQRFKFESESSLPSPTSPSPDASCSDVSPPITSRHQIMNYNGSKGDLCAVCGYSAIGKDNLRCSECDYVFHAKCYPTASQYPCISYNMRNSGSFSEMGRKQHPQPSRPPRNKGRPSKSYSSGKASRSRNGSMSSQATGSSSWSVTRTAEFTDPRDVLVTDVSELHYLETFLSKKINLMEMDVSRFSASSKKDSIKESKESSVDVVFKCALKEFKTNLISTYSVASQDQTNLHISYKNLIDHFEQVITHVCAREKTWKSFPVIMGVNAFRGFLDEFRSLAARNMLTAVSSEAKKKSSGGNKRRRNKKMKTAKPEDLIESFGHNFKPVQANIPTVCEVCSSLMWLMEKIWVCQGCKLTCHKKCTAKISNSCRNNRSTQRKDSCADAKRGCFGLALELLVDEDRRVPKLVEDLMTLIEMKGLYTEGLYRKSGTTSKINEVKMKLDRGEVVDYDAYSIHVLSAVLKSFFREMPEPLMTFELYDDFLWATTISDSCERVQAIYSHISKLPRANYDLLERLSFHLARVAQQEPSNRMNSNSLAIVFAPCVLRTDKNMQMQDKLSDISKQTICLQSIISERLKQLCDTLADIDILDTAFRTASSRLSSLRHSKLHLNCETTSQSNSRIQETSAPEQEEENILKQQLETLRTEKAHLTNILPSFRLTTAESDEDPLTEEQMDEDSAASTVGGSLEPETASPTQNKPFKLSDVATVEYPAQFPKSGLKHLTKHRAHLPSNRRLPSRYKMMSSSSSNEVLESSSSAAPVNNGGASSRRSCSITSCSSFMSNTPSSRKESNQDTPGCDASVVKIEESLFHPDDKPVSV